MDHVTDKIPTSYGYPQQYGPPQGYYQQGPPPVRRLKSPSQALACVRVCVRTGRANEIIFSFRCNTSSMDTHLTPFEKGKRKTRRHLIHIYVGDLRSKSQGRRETADASKRVWPHSAAASFARKDVTLAQTASTGEIDNSLIEAVLRGRLLLT